MSGFGHPALPWEPLPYMDEYLNELTAQLKSPDYIRKVKMGLAHFSIYCAERAINHPEQVERRDIVGFVGSVNRRPDWGKRHQAQIFKYVRGWFNWLEQVHYIEHSPWFRIKIGGIPKKPNPLSDEELDLLFETHRRSAFSTAPFLYHRREVVLVLLYGWGLRIHELHSLNVANVDLRLDYVTCRNKGGTSKPLPYPDVMKRVVQRWLQIRGPKAVVGEDALVIDSQGRRLSIDMIRRIIVDLGKKAGLDINPHMLRDTFGTNMLDADVPIERVSVVMGHRNIAQTRSYSRVNDHKVAESHAKAMNPRLTDLLFGRTSEMETKP